jgi:hypothetical protein
LKINDIVSKRTPRPIITLQTSSGLSCKWLFDSGAAITCISVGAFKSIPIHIRQKMIGEGGRNEVGASGASLVPKGTYLLPLEWNVKKIMPARTCVPVRLGRASGRRHTPMAAWLKSVITIGNPDYPALFPQPGLVVPNHEGDVTILLQNFGDVEIEIPRCTAIGYLSSCGGQAV